MPIQFNQSHTHGPNAEAFVSGEVTPLCFLPICPYSFMESKAFLKEFMPWALGRCEKPIILIDDHMERHNIMFFLELDEKQAQEKATKRSSKLRRTLESLEKEHGGNGKAEILSSRKILQEDHCKEILSKIKQYYDSHEGFRKDIVDQIMSMRMISNKKEAGHAISDSDLDLLKNYLLEEIAVYLSLYARGYTTEIYPGRDTQILMKLRQGTYRNFPYSMKERTHISVALFMDNGKTYSNISE